ncbi:hypothetical protein C0Q70_03478 [Pomacea canaliculata]|uniref:TIR domain-containing protein n=1 Tax=Pomacea canaliculata TaxID=400727 RepID=A0A2T7PSV3_POMCA|nr:hypothetical protein C0Q70_03478 [Pomacea canaliculata]
MFTLLIWNALPCGFMKVPSRKVQEQHFPGCGLLQTPWNLTYIPRLPDNTTFLNFSYNALSVIPEDFFSNVSSLVVLDLSDNNVTVINPRAFQNMYQLKKLFLNYNFYLNYSTLQPVFRIPTLNNFELGHGGLKAVPKGFFLNFSLPNLQFLSLDDNHLRNIHLKEFTHLKSLLALDVVNNKVSKVYSAPLPLLTFLDLKTNGIFDFPDTCNKTGNASLFPSLEKLILRQNLISTIPTQTCLPKLQTLDLSENLFKVISSDMFRHFHSLIDLNMQSMSTKLSQIQERAFSSATLQVISLMYNDIEFGEDVVHSLSFTGCPNITSLQLSHNYFNRMTDAKFRILFGHLTKLTELFLGSCMIDQISTDAFANFTSITMLHLYENQLTDLPDGAFDTMTSLQTLVLTSNRLSVIRQSTFSPETRARLHNLDVANNPFMCSCDLTWFQQWFVSSPGLFASYQGSYSCEDLGVSLSSFYLSEQACLLSTGVYTLTVVAAAMVIVTLTLTIVVFRYRWHFRLLMYEAFRAGSQRRQQLFLSRGFRYDIFLSYANEDVTWVSRYLVPRLEEGLGLRLCLHQRDFIPGRNIVDNIASSVETSKKMLMVFSEHFARSQWCQFELSLCLHHAMDRDDALLIVCLDNISSRDLTAAMLAVLKTTTFIQWDDDSDAQSSFWGRLSVALQEITPSVVTS